MYQLKIIRHAEVTQSELDEIVKIKSVAWPYPYEEQIKWIDNNLTENDLHVVLMLNEEQPVAYLNLAEKQLQVNGDKISALGVGNVCSVEPGKGYGSILMEKVSDYLNKKNIVGILFCKRELVNFYKKFGWSKRRILKDDSSNIISMVYNLASPNNVEITYTGQLF